MKKLLRVFKILLLTIGGLFAAFLLWMGYVVQRNLNEAAQLVQSRIEEVKALQSPAPPNLVAAFDRAYPEESPHGSYLGYLYEHKASFQNEQLNLMTTRMIVYGRRPNLSDLLEVDYVVHNLSRAEKIDFVFHEAGKKVFGNFDEISRQRFSKPPAELSLCESLFVLLMVVDPSENPKSRIEALAAKHPELIQCQALRPAGV